MIRWAMFAFLAASAAAQSPALRMYVLDCGTLYNRDPANYNLTRQQVQSVDMSDPCFLIVHPRQFGRTGARTCPEGYDRCGAIEQLDKAAKKSARKR